MIHVGIDDTDVVGSPGTNQLARCLVRRVAGQFRCRLIVRHQLLEDPRVPCTSKNGSASMLLEPRGEVEVAWLIGELRSGMREWFVPGSDPGLCVAASVPAAIVEFGRRCQREWIEQQDARGLASRHGLHLEGLGGTEGGVIGALAAVGLAAQGDDGRVVQIGSWPDDLAGPQELETLHARGVEVRGMATGESVTSGRIDVGKHLRPNYRRGAVVLFVEPCDDSAVVRWRAVRLPY